MRESIGGAWLLGIVMVFMMVFVAYISITINYSNAYKLKTEMLTVIEQYDGLTTTAKDKLDALMNSHSYRNTLKCDLIEGEKVIGVRNGVITTNPTTPQQYCLSRELRVAEDGNEDRYYYNLTLAFDFSLPILGDIFKFKVAGETNVIYYPNDGNLFN